MRWLLRVLLWPIVFVVMTILMCLAQIEHRRHHR